jgi:phosphomannomutase
MPLSDFFSQVDAVIKRDDIRGIYGVNIDREFAYNLGLLLAEPFMGNTAVQPTNVVIGHDMRLSGPVLAQALREGLDDGGCRPIMLGQAGTELVGFLPAKYPDEIDGGIIITASHNPKDNNGFKFFGRAGKPLPLAGQEEPPLPDDELQRIALGLRKQAVPERLTWEDFAPDYIETILERARCDFEAATEGTSEPMRVAVEAGNGMGGRILREFAGVAPGLDWTFSNEMPDGNFPIIIPNPLNAEYQGMVAELVESSGSHVGICFDGDADRVAVADENGEMISPPLLATLVGQRLRDRFGAEERIAFNLACSWVIADTLGDRKEVLGESGVQMTPVGYGKIKAIMYDDPNIIFGAEHSGHYMFRNFWCTDSGMMAGILILELAAELHSQGKALSSILEEPRNTYFESGEINFELPPDRPAEQVIQKATEKFGDEIERIYVVVDDRVRLVDAYPPEGLELSVSDVRAEAGDWWFCMRKSGTEGGAGDLLRLYLEAYGDRDLMESRRDALVEMIGPELKV